MPQGRAGKGNGRKGKRDEDFVDWGTVEDSRFKKMHNDPVRTCSVAVVSPVLSRPRHIRPEIPTPTTTGAQGQDRQPIQGHVLKPRLQQQCLRFHRLAPVATALVVRALVPRAG